MAATVLTADFSEHVSIKQTHYHDGYQLLFVTRGTANVYVNNAVHKVSAGDLLIFSRLEQHAVKDQSGDYQRFILELAPDISATDREGYRIYSILFNRPAGFCNIVDMRGQQDAVCRMFEAICREIRDSAPMGEEMQRLLVQQLLILIYRQARDRFSVMEGAGFELVYPIQMRFHQQFQQQFTLQALAEELNISASYLSHVFKSTTGSSVMGYLQSCRIAEAKKCLAQTSMRISEIVEHCGFTDSSNFSRTFRSLTGLSPSAFRGRYHKQDKQEDIP